MTTIIVFMESSELHVYILNDLYYFPSCTLIVTLALWITFSYAYFIYLSVLVFCQPHQPY